MISFFFDRARRKNHSPADISRLLVFSFACAILLGALLLTGPSFLPASGKR